MMNDQQIVTASISGSGNVSENVEYDVEAVTPDGGEHPQVRVMLRLWSLELATDFSIEAAERFFTDFRDELVRGQAGTDRVGGKHRPGDGGRR